VATLGWNVVGVVILAYAAIAARSVALAGFGLDSVIEIGASTVVLWELAEVAQIRRRRALRLIGSSFIALAAYLGVQSTVILVIGFRPHHSPLGIAWTAVTAVAMFALASGKKSVGRSLNNPVILAEGHVTLIDAVLASAVMVGLFLNAFVGWWWADPVTGYVILYYALREARGSLKS
jgi:divalent metal cation (Fe/Co/Zn/Cd) transporter